MLGIFHRFRFSQRTLVMAKTITIKEFKIQLSTGKRDKTAGSRRKPRSRAIPSKSDVATSFRVSWRFANKIESPDSIVRSKRLVQLVMDTYGESFALFFFPFARPDKLTNLRSTCQSIEK